MVDTRQKRSSAATVATPWMPPSIVVDGSIDTQDRPHIGWTYAGITISSSVPLTDLPADALLLLVEAGRILVLTETYRELVPLETDRILKLVD